MAIICGKAIQELIPQCDPMIMIDTLFDATELEAETGFSIADDNLFCSDGLFTEPGLVEHIAQSASAFAGYKARLADKPTPLGLIGEVRKCRIYFLPRAGEKLRTHIRILSEALGVSLLVADTKRNGEVVVQCQVKIYTQRRDTEAQSDTVVNTEGTEGRREVIMGGYYIIDSVMGEGDETIFCVTLLPDFCAYKGHFPGKPISPGVCNMQMIKECAEQLAGQRLFLGYIAQCRFSAVITPQTTPHLRIRMQLSQADGLWKVKASVSDDTTNYIDFKGDLVTTASLPLHN